MNFLDIGHGDLQDFDQAVRREWLITNGLGGYASGTVGEANARRYHGALVAALQPPLGRIVTVAKLDVTLRHRDLDMPMTSNEFADGSIEPHGYRHIERFRLTHGTPLWHYAFDDVLIEKHMLMPYGENTTLIRYRVLRASAPARLTLRPLCTYRDYHGHTRGGWNLGWEPLVDGFRITAYDGAQPYIVRVAGAEEVVENPAWYWRFRHRQESRRGLDDTEDLFVPGDFQVELTAGESVTVVISTELVPSADFDSAWRSRRWLADSR